MMQKLWKHIMLWWKSFFNLFYPDICQSCGDYLLQQEHAICTKCLFQLPKTNFHLIEDNAITMLFWGKVRIEYATAFAFFKKAEKMQHLIYQLKYRNKKDIGIELGKQLGLQLKSSDFFQTVDIIVPVPLHPKKKRMRGYNQSELIAKGIAFVMQKQVNFDNLYRTVHTESQTKKDKFERWENVKNVFQLKDSHLFRDKHILLIDDVVTTGATLEACAKALLKSSGCRVSVATLACA